MSYSMLNERAHEQLGEDAGDASCDWIERMRSRPEAEGALDGEQ
jgi:hypothetical protein